MKPPISWYGGKTIMAKRLLKYIPEHKKYGEVFGGAGGVLFAKEPSEFEVFNDINSNLINLYRVLRDEEKFNKFYKMACVSLWSRDEFWYAYDNINNPEMEDYERAFYFFVVARQAFNGKPGIPSWSMSTGKSSRGMASTCSKYLSSVDRLPAVHERLKRVQIDNTDFRNFFKLYISKWDYEDSFVYLDPPYVPETRISKKAYRFEMSYEDHEDLIHLLLSHYGNSKFMLSGYDNPLYNILEQNGWNKICFEWTSWATRNSKISEKPRRTECIWINYDVENLK